MMKFFSAMLLVGCCAVATKNDARESDSNDDVNDIDSDVDALVGSYRSLMEDDTRDAASVFASGGIRCDAGKADNVYSFMGVARQNTRIPEGEMIAMPCTLPGWSGVVYVVCLNDGTEDGGFKKNAGECVPNEELPSVNVSSQASPALAATSSGYGEWSLNVLTRNAAAEPVGGIRIVVEQTNVYGANVFRVDATTRNGGARFFVPENGECAETTLRSDDGAQKQSLGCPQGGDALTNVVVVLGHHHRAAGEGAAFDGRNAVIAVDVVGVTCLDDAEVTLTSDDGWSRTKALECWETGVNEEGRVQATAVFVKDIGPPDSTSSSPCSGGVWTASVAYRRPRLHMRHSFGCLRSTYAELTHVFHIEEDDEDDENENENENVANDATVRSVLEEHDAPPTYPPPPSPSYPPPSPSYPPPSPSYPPPSYPPLLSYPAPPPPPPSVNPPQWPPPADELNEDDEYSCSGERHVDVVYRASGNFSLLTLQGASSSCPEEFADAVENELQTALEELFPDVFAYGDADQCRRFVRHGSVRAAPGQGDASLVIPLSIVLPDDDGDVPSTPSVREVERLIDDNGDRLADRLDRRVLEETKGESSTCPVMRVTRSSLRVSRGGDASAATPTSWSASGIIPMMLTTLALLAATQM